ncbi:MAG: helix-turn-helix transcriptional regulator [Desulfuromonadaceae bacterium]|nr:helix-turn-helix transcriptional regulator [Desulfuromonadaceae bacterium]
MKVNAKPNEISYQLGRRVAALRQNAGMCQEDLATILGLGQPSSISNREQGITEFTPRELSQVSQYFGVTLDYLILGKGESDNTSESTRIARQIFNLAQQCSLDRLVMLLHLAQTAADASRMETSRSLDLERKAAENP